MQPSGLLLRISEVIDDLDPSVDQEPAVPGDVLILLRRLVVDVLNGIDLGAEDGGADEALRLTSYALYRMFEIGAEFRRRGYELPAQRAA